MNEFDSTPYLFIRDSDVRQTNTRIELSDESYFVKSKRDYSVLRGQEIKDALDISKDLLFVLGIQDTDRLSFFIYSVVRYFYREHYLTAYRYGLDKIRQNVIFVCEESQNLFDSSIISKSVFNRLRKMYSETRNLKSILS